jgi:hypothetical protein
MPSRRTLRLFGIFVGEFGQFAAALFVEFRDGNAKQLSVGLRIEAKSRVANRLVHRLYHRPVPHLDGEKPRLRRAHRPKLVDGHGVAVGFHCNGIEQRGVGASGPQARKLVFQRRDRAVHPPVHVFLVEGARHALVLRAAAPV